MDMDRAKDIAANFLGGRTRKVRIDLVVEADSEADLDVIERMLRETYRATSSIVVYQDMRSRVTAYRYTAEVTVA